jgi:hypothetical protein
MSNGTYLMLGGTNPGCTVILPLASHAILNQIKYLGIVISVHKLPKTALQSMVVDKLPF